MGQVIVSADTDTFLRTANNAAARTALGLGDAATKDTGTTAGTVAAGNDSRITGAVQTTRTVSAGTGLTGGGDLSANRTLAISFGSTAGTACEGNDARLSNSRTPTAHAASHAAAGSDPITITSAQISGSLTQNTTGTASNVTGTVATSNGGTGQTTYTNGQLLIGNSSGGLTKATLTGGTNVTITNGNGSITIDATAGAGGVSSFSAGTTGLTPATTTTGAVTLAGTLTESNGGTGESTYTSGQLLIGNASGGLTKAKLTPGTNVSIVEGDGSITISATGGGGSGTVTSVGVSGGTTGLTTSGGPVTGSGTITLAGTLTESNGGTGETTYTNGQLLIGNASGGLTKATLTAGSNVTITNGDGAITIASTGGGGGGSTTDRQLFLSSGTWTKPAGAKLVVINGVSGGGAGGPGSRTFEGRTSYGGSGGGSGQFLSTSFDANILPSTLTVTVGAGGTNSIASFFLNDSPFSAASSGNFPSVSKSSKYFFAALASGSGGAIATLSTSTGGSGASINGNTGGNSGGSNSITSTGPSSGSGGSPSSNSTGLTNVYLYGNSFVSATASTTSNFQTPTTKPMAWIGTLENNGCSGGIGGAPSRDSGGKGLAGSGGDGGGWFAPVTLTSVSTTNASNTVTCASTSGLVVGMTLSGIVSETATSYSVASIVNSTTFTLNANAQSTASGLTVLAACGAGGGGGGGGATTASTPILITGLTLTSGSTSATCTSTRGILPGMTVFSNANIPASTTIATVDSETAFTLSAAATGSETAGKFVIAGIGTLSGVATTNANSAATATSTLGLTWGQALYNTTGFNPTSANNARFCHVGSIDSATGFTLTRAAYATGSAQTVSVMNTVGFLSGASATAGSNVVTVSDTAPLYAGMIIQFVGSTTWSTTAGSGSITFGSNLGSISGVFYGEGITDRSPSISVSGTTGTTTASNVVATTSNKTCYYPLPAGNSTFTNNVVKIVSVDSATQITVSQPCTTTTTNQTLMYAFSGGNGGTGGAGAIEIVTYF